MVRNWICILHSGFYLVSRRPEQLCEISFVALALLCCYLGPLWFEKVGVGWISIRSGWLWKLLAEQEVEEDLRLGIARLLLHLFKLDRLIGVLRLRCHRFKDYGILQKISTSTSRQIKTFTLLLLYLNGILSNLCEKIFSANIVGRFCRLDFLLEIFHLGEWNC